MELTGLTYEEIKIRNIRGLNNKSSKPKTRTIYEIVIQNVFSLFNYIIFGIIAFVLYFYFKYEDQRLLLDSIGILTIAVTNTFIAIYQEIKSKKALDKVNLLLKKKVTAIRESTKELIDITDIVLGEVIEIKRGDQIVVDGIILKSKMLEIDESLLTGESVPIDKFEGDKILSGSFCIAGAGYYKAEKVGEDVYANSVTNLAKKFKFSLTPLQRKINLILKILFGVAIILVLAEVINWNLNPNIEFVDFVRKIATILISLVPQGLVLLSSVTFAVGVYRISKIGAIVQKLNAIESFSNVKVVCMDKTGTLTENKLKIHSFLNLSNYILNEEIKLLLGTYSHNSTEKNATISALDAFEYYKAAEYIEEIPFNSSAKYSVLKLKIKDTSAFYILGAYDILLEQVNNDSRIITAEKFSSNNLNLYRNLLFGKITNINTLKEVKENLQGIDIEPISIVSISDTVRSDVFEALNLFKENNIDFKILSGDSGEAISAVLKEIGWSMHQDDIINGRELDGMNEEDFQKTVISKSVFGRLKPEHKLRIIKVLKKNNIYTAMIGDGVNDLPAIKQADMGIAMEEGSSITKEVADIVLLKNKFSLLPEIFNEGNKIVNSVNSVAKLFLTKNFLVIYLSLITLTFLLDFPLTPRRVSLLNVFAIGLPAMILTIKNQNIAKCVNFVKDSFSYVIISSIIIITGGYTGYYFTLNYYLSTRPESEMVMMTIIIFISVANFIIVAKESQEHSFIYYFYGLLLIGIYTFLSTTNIDFSFLRLLKIFYEINHINPEHWFIILITSIVSSGILFIIHKIRRKYFIK